MKNVKSMIKEVAWLSSVNNGFAMAFYQRFA